MSRLIAGRFINDKGSDVFGNEKVKRIVYILCVTEYILTFFNKAILNLSIEQMSFLSTKVFVCKRTNTFVNKKLIVNFFCSQSGNTVFQYITLSTSIVLLRLFIFLKSIYVSAGFYI